MRLAKALFLGLALVGLAGCGSTPTRVPTTLQDAKVIAQDAINEANQWLIAAANVIASNVKEGIMTKAEAQAALDHVRKLGDDADRAQRLLDSGDPDALDVANLTRTAIIALHREVAARARRTP